MTEQDLTNISAEESVIGAIMVTASKAMPILIDIECNVDWFFSPSLREIWKICVELHDAKRPIDALVVADLAVKKDCSPGVVQAVEDCTNAHMAIAHLEYYADIIKDLAHKRLQKSIIHKHLNELSGERSAIDISNSLRYEIENIKYETIKTKTDDEILEIIRARYKAGNESGFVGIPSRWLALQNKLGGYKRGKVCLLAARPSIGKTTVACNEARYMAEQGYKVGFISLETDEEEIYETMAAEKARVNLFKMYKGELKAGELHKFDEAVQQVIKLPIYISDKSMDIRHLINWIYYMADKKKLDVIIIDYIQIISDSPKSKTKNMREKISHCSKEIFKATRDNNVATILLSQISRGGEAPPNIKDDERWKFTPKLHHLKESGALEEDAYQAILLYNDPDDGMAKGRATISFIFDVAKNKKGPTGFIKMIYKKEEQRIEDKIYA